jgi:hypothetical protein
MGDAPRLRAELPAAEALRLLGSVSVGRIVFSMRAMPAIRAVTHIVDGGVIIVRSYEGAAIVPATRAVDGAVVAYEADAIDPSDHLGWSAVVTGLARLVTDPAEVARYQALMRPWAAGEMDDIIEIRPHLVSGFRLVKGGDAAGRG